MEVAPRKLQHAKIETLDFITTEMRARSPATPFAVEVGGRRYSGDAEFGVTDDGVFLIRFFDERTAVHAGLSKTPAEEVTGDGSAPPPANEAPKPRSRREHAKDAVA